MNLLRRALTELSGYVDVHFRAHVLSTREVYGEKQEGGRSVCTREKIDIPTHCEIPGKRVSFVAGKSVCTQ